MAALENILSPQIVQKLGWTLLHFVWQAGVVALLLAILLRALRKSTPNIRYIVACAAIALIILMPTITFNLLSAPAASPVESIPISARVSAALQEPYDADMPLGRAAQYMQTPRYTSWQERADQVCAAVLPYLVAGWLVGVFGLSIWHLGGWAQLHRLKSRMVEDVNLFVHSTLQQLSGKLGVNKVVQVVKSALVEVPTVVGWIRPVVLLPASALTGLSSQQLEALLAHELAHIRRHDYLVNMLQTAVEILGFYHPAVWWISRTIRLERENCCDDMAISVCGDARQYVKALAEMERIRCGQAELAIAASGGNLSRRISRLLGKEAGGKTHASWVPAVIAAILLIALAIPASLALPGADSEDTSAAAISNLAAGTTTDQMLPPAPSSAEITDKPQITVECTFFEVPADSEFVKGKNPGDVIIRLDGEFSSLLEALIRATQGAHVLTAPKAIMLDGEEVHMVIGGEVPCITGYELGAGADEQSKPIIKYVSCGLGLKIKAEVVNSDRFHMDIHLTTRSKPTEQKDASGRTIHATASSDYTSEMTVKDGETIIICGTKDEDRPNQILVLQITPHIIRPDEKTGQVLPDIESKEAAPKTHVQAEGETEMASSKVAANSPFFWPIITCLVNDMGERKDCLIDFDNNKLFSPPSDFYSRDREQQELWKRENGIDASATISEGAEGLWGEEMVVIPVTNEGFDRMTPVSFRDLLRQAKSGTPAVMTAIGELPKTYVFKTREGGMGLLQILQVQREQAPQHIKIQYKMVPRTVEADAKITSNQKLQDLGKAMVFFAQDHQRTLPDTLQEFAPYLRNKQDIEWLSQNVEYLGKGKTEKDWPDTIIAYDKSLLKSGQGTNVLFLDAHVEYVQADRLEKLSITGQIHQRFEAAKKLSNFGKALLVYAVNHENKYPDFLQQLREYVNEEDLKWALDKLEYLAKGKTPAGPPETVIAYDKGMLAEGKGTNVLFNDRHVDFVKPERLKGLGIAKPAIQIETRILRVSEDFLKDIGLDTNSIRDANSWPEPKPSVAQASEGSDTYSLILNDLNVSFLLRATQAQKGAETLAAPKVVVLDGEEARLAIQEAVHYVSGYTESKSPSGEAEPKHDSLSKGIELQLMPNITPDNKHILLDVNFKLCELIRFETRMYKEKHPYEIPEMDMVDFQTRVAVPDRETLLIGGQKVTVEVERQSTVPILGKLPIIGRAFRSYSKIKDQKMLLILIKPTVLLQE